MIRTSMRKALSTIIACIIPLFLASCTMIQTNDGFPVLQVQVAGRVLSSKAMSVCWPWPLSSETGTVTFCARGDVSPVNGSSGFLVYARIKSR